MKRVLVTGGAGFIGSHLCKKLVNEGNHVICLDNFQTGNKHNIEDLIHHKNFELIFHDVINPYYTKIDCIYNFACPASPGQYQIDPISTVRTSVMGAINMLELAKSNGARILQASTSEVYGDPTIHPQPEYYWGNVNPIGLRSCYDEGKRCAETLFMDYHRQANVDIKIIRIFNTYGPYMHPNDGRVVSNFIVQALKNENITIYGNGNHSRSFQYIDDLLDGITKLMNSQNFTGPVNIGNPVEFTVLQLAQMIVAMTGSTSKIVYMPLPSDDPQQRKPEITLAKNMLDWEPKTPLITGLERTIDYFKSIL